MKILKSQRKDNTYLLELEESHDAIQAAMEPAFQKVAKNVQIPGFRKGKVTRAIFERYYGDGPILKEAVSNVVNNAYFQAIQELKLNILDFPKNVQISEYQPDKPIHFSCEVDVMPEVKLGKYKGLKVKQLAVEVDPNDIEAEIKALLENHADFVSVDRLSKEGDIVRFHIKAEIDGVPYEPWTRENAGTLIGRGNFGKAFDAHVSNVQKDTSKQFSVTYEDDFLDKSVAGKTVQFDVVITDVREKTLPELTDEWAEKFLRIESVEKLKNSIREHLSSQKNTESTSKLRRDLIDAALENTKIIPSDILVERQIDHKLHMLDHQFRQSKSSLEQYLTLTKKPLSEVREELRESAKKDVLTGLILSAIASEEKMEVSDAEIDAEIQKWKIDGVTNAQTLKTYSPNANLDHIRDSILETKTYDLLISEAKISK